MLVDAVERVVVESAMASTVRLIASDGSDLEVGDAMSAALGAIRAVERTCSRLDPPSELSRVNAAASSRQEVSDGLLSMIALAVEGYRSTDGRFDPRVLSDLVQMGYDRTFVEVDDGRGEVAKRAPLAAWTPMLDLDRSQLDLAGQPIDLGGVAKGAAADLALQAMARHGVHGLVDIGGDGAVSGTDAAGAPWSIGIEDPIGDAEPIAVFVLSKGGYATSSTRLRHWQLAGERVHHLIDPSTGRPGGGGLRSVTVLATTGAQAEIASKAAFLSGSSGIARVAEDGALACVWVDGDGTTRWSSAMTASLIWVRP